MQPANVVINRGAVMPGSELLPRILIVGDETEVAAPLREYLRSHGFNVTVESRGERAVERIWIENPAVVILDVSLPRLGGIGACQRARERYTNGILLLGSSGTDADQIIALELGADDYVVWPVEPRILVARIRSVLRRVGGSPLGNPPGELSVGRLRMIRASRAATVAGRRVALTSIEFSLLWLLASRAGDVVSRDGLSLGVRGTPHDGLDRAIDVHVSRLRQKLEAAGLNPGSLRAVRGVGYLYVDCG